MKLPIFAKKFLLTAKLEQEVDYITGAFSVIGLYEEWRCKDPITFLEKLDDETTINDLLEDDPFWCSAYIQNLILEQISTYGDKIQLSKNVMEVVDFIED